MLAAHLANRRKRLIIVGAAAGYIVTASNYAPVDGEIITITAQLVDAANHSVHTAGRVVTWSKSDPGGSFGAATSNTDANGIATVTLTVVGGVTLTVTGTDAGSLTGTSPSIVVSADIDPLIQDLIDGLLDGGSADLYAGTPPRSTLDPATGSTLLGSFGLSDPAAPAGNLVSSTSIDIDTSDATAYVADSGTDKWLRIREPDGTVIADVLVATSAEPIIIASDTVTLAQVLTLTLNAAVA